VFKATNGGSINFKVGHLPKNMAVQIKDSSDGEYTNVYDATGVWEKYVYFAICEGNCKDGDFDLEPDKKYLLRMMFNQTSLDKIEYSNEYVIDTSKEGEYMQKNC